jgi:hypothetical protein
MRTSTPSRHKRAGAFVLNAARIGRYCLPPYSTTRRAAIPASRWPMTLHETS